MKLAFKRPTSFWDYLICARTLSSYCHVELVFESHLDDIRDLIARYDLRLLGAPAPGLVLCFSSLPADHGTRFKYLGLDPKTYDVIDAPPAIRNDDMRAALICSHICGLSYDWMAIIGFVVPIGLHAPADRMCSEADVQPLDDLLSEYEAHYERLGNAPPWRVSPGALYKAVMRLNEGTNGPA